MTDSRPLYSYRHTGGACCFNLHCNPCHETQNVYSS